VISFLSKSHVKGFNVKLEQNFQKSNLLLALIEPGIGIFYLDQLWFSWFNLTDSKHGWKDVFQPYKYTQRTLSSLFFSFCSLFQIDIFYLLKPTVQPNSLHFKMLLTTASLLLWGTFVSALHLPEKRSCPKIHVFGARETTASQGYGSSSSKFSPCSLYRLAEKLPTNHSRY